MKSLKLSLSLYPRIYFGLFLIIGLVLGRYVFPVNEPEMWKASCPERETLYAFKVRTWEPQGFQGNRIRKHTKSIGNLGS
jgi:hypothetical protein